MRRSTADAETPATTRSCGPSARSGFCRRRMTSQPAARAARLCGGRSARACPRARRRTTHRVVLDRERKLGDQHVGPHLATAVERLADGEGVEAQLDGQAFADQRSKPLLGRRGGRGRGRGVECAAAVLGRRLGTTRGRHRIGARPPSPRGERLRTAIDAGHRRRARKLRRHGRCLRRGRAHRTPVAAGARGAGPSALLGGRRHEFVADGAHPQHVDVGRGGNLRQQKLSVLLGAKLGDESPIRRPGVAKPPDGVRDVEPGRPLAPGPPLVETARHAARLPTTPDTMCRHVGHGNWWALRDSNPRHPRCKRGALTN